MKIVNQSNQSIIADRVIIADKFIKRLVGLLNRSGIDEGEALIIVPCKSIHSFGMRFAFDAVFLDKNNKIVHLIKNMKPCRVSTTVQNAFKVIELPAGTIDKSGLRSGNVIEFKDI